MLHDAYITNTAVFLPNARITNDDIETVLGSLGRQSRAVKRRVLMNNGIVSRHYAVDPATQEMTHTNTELTVAAIRGLEHRGQSLESMQVLACGTSSPDQLIPSHASMVHADLEVPPCEVVCTSGVCCSGMSALKYGYMSVLTGMSKNAVTTGSELASPSLRAAHFRSQHSPSNESVDKSPILAFSDAFLRWMLSDGAGALWIDSCPNNDQVSLRIDWMDLLSFANESEVCMYCGMRKHEDGSATSYRVVDDPDTFHGEGFLNLAQDVRVLQDRLPTLMARAIERTISKHELSPKSIDWLLPHYSSDWFREPLFDGLQALNFEIPFDRWFTNLATKGNTGSASIYIILDELMYSGQLKVGESLLCVVPESARMTFALMHLTVV